MSESKPSAIRTENGWMGLSYCSTHVPGVSSIPEMWKWVCHNRPQADAFLYLRHGNWVPISTEEFNEQMQCLTLALAEHGIAPGETLGIIASPSPWWLMMDLAVQSIGAITVPLFPNLTIENFDYEVDKASIRHLFIDQDRALSSNIRKRLGSFDNVIALGASRSGYTPLFFFDLIDEGRVLREKHPDKYASLCERIVPEQVATIIFTSGSSGTPKGVQLTHRNLISQLRATWGRFPTVYNEDRVLSGLPIAHAFERVIVYYYVSTGVKLYFADDTRHLGELLQSVHPQALTVVPRLLDKVMEKMRANANNSKPVVKWVINAAIDYAVSRQPRIAKGWTPTQHITSPLHWLFDVVVYRKMRAALGGGLRFLVCGGAKLSAETRRYFLNIGTPIVEGYGLTECSPIVAANVPWDNDLLSVGYPFPDVEVKLSEENELLVRGDNVMLGYLDEPEKTAEVLDPDGWYHTGDRSEFTEDGRIVIVGRVKEMFKTSNGKYVSPLPIEHALESHPLVALAMVVADGRKHPSALLFADNSAVPAWQKEHNLPAQSPDEFWQNPLVMEEMQKLIADVNARQCSWERVIRWRVIQQVPSIADGGLTPTLKLRRPIVDKRFAAEIESLYA